MVVSFVPVHSQAALGILASTGASRAVVARMLKVRVGANSCLIVLSAVPSSGGTWGWCRDWLWRWHGASRWNRGSCVTEGAIAVVVLDDHAVLVNGDCGVPSGC